MTNFLEYRGVLAQNRDVFLVNESSAVRTFARIDQAFEQMTTAIIGSTTPDGKTHVSMIPLLGLMQRQFRAAFHSIASYQSYEAWLLIRPAIEIPLIIGKWVDDRKNVQVWQNRGTNAKAYKNCYQGQALHSQSLTDSARIQQALSRLNDLFVHPNPDYCMRHVSIQDVGDGETVNLRMEYFDDPRGAKCAWLAMAHLMVFVQDRLWNLIASKLVGVPAGIPAIREFEATFRGQANEMAEESAEYKRTLTALGLWTFKP